MHINPNGEFVEYSLTQEELERGYQFNSEQRAVLQNLKAQAGLEIVTYVINPMTGTEQDRLIQAKLQGQVEILSHLLNGPAPEQPSSQD